MGPLAWGGLTGAPFVEKRPKASLVGRLTRFFGGERLARGPPLPGRKPDVLHDSTPHLQAAQGGVELSTDALGGCRAVSSQTVCGAAPDCQADFKASTVHLPTFIPDVVPSVPW